MSYSQTELQYRQYVARLNELRRMKEHIESRIKDAEYNCGYWQDKVNKERKK